MSKADPFLETDSLDRVELIMAFDGRVPDNHEKKFQAVRHAIEQIDRLEAKQQKKKSKNEEVAVAVTSQKSEEREWPQ